MLAVVTVRVARRVIPKTVKRLAAASQRDARWEQRTRTLSGTLVSVIGVVVWAIAFITVVGQLGFNLGPLLAGAGVVGVAVGFGAQQLVRDIISGFFILVEDQFGVGDTVTAGGVTGTVESMTLRLTRLRGDDGVLHHLRNGDLGVVSNSARGYGVATASLPVPADADFAAVLDRVRAALTGIADDPELAELLLAEPQVLGLTGFRDATGTPLLTINARVRPDGKARIQRELIQRGLAAVPEPPARPATAAARRPSRPATKAPRSGDR